ncbi:hypothetical protein [Actibacterium lipolyticum]|uniref:Uncharacterized protein n=1 Tax=Actibacterium lipolyticum TaxID=1524263 RepID=A0A238JTW2_9RHOB|nr:hypothetical protein [Actibacterium lipolyticum]SMX34025.1 hypothetical protein COL8621_01153 [Actibacterium lipolyticum]
MSVFASASSAADISRQIPVDEEFVPMELGGGSIAPWYVFRIKIIEVNGMFEVCGAGRFSNAQVRGQARRFLRHSGMKVNGKKLIQDLTYFSRVKKISQLDTAQANCRATNVKAPKGEANFEMDWSSKTYYY